MTNRETKFSIVRFKTDETPEVEGFRCVRVMIPDDDEYARILAAVVATMTDRTNWEGVQADRSDRAARCLEGYLQTDWEGCVDCDEVADCIETDEGVQEAITDLIQANSQFPPDFPYGQNLPTSETTRNLVGGTNPTCDKDILWAQCLGVVMATNDAIKDVLQKVEVSSNVVELANALFSAVPLVSTAKNLAGIDGALDMVNYYQEAVLEGYEAQYTETPGGVRDQLACALFCACADDCEITIDRVVGVWQDRLSVYVSPPSLTGFVDFIETLAGISQDTTFVVDLAFFVAWGAIKTGNFFFGQVYNQVLDIIIALKADEPSNDWIILCDCPEEWYYTADLADLAAWNDYVLADAGIYNGSAGWESDPASTFNGTAIFGRETSAPFLCLDVTVKITAPMTGDQNAVFVGDLALATAFQDIMGTDVEWTVPIEEILDGLAIGYAPNDTGAGYPDFPGATYEVTVHGFGYQPPELGG